MCIHFIFNVGSVFNPGTTPSSSSPNSFNSVLGPLETPEALLYVLTLSLGSPKPPSFLPRIGIMFGCRRLNRLHVLPSLFCVRSAVDGTAVLFWLSHSFSPFSESSPCEDGACSTSICGGGCGEACGFLDLVGRRRGRMAGTEVVISATQASMLEKKGMSG